MTEEQEREWKGILESIGSPASRQSTLGKIVMTESTYFAADSALRALRSEVARLENNEQALNDAHCEMMTDIERLREEAEQARRTAEYWKAEHREGNVRIAALEGAIRSVRDGMLCDQQELHAALYRVLEGGEG